MNINANGASLKSFVTFRLARLQSRLNAQAMRLLKAHSDLSLTEWRVLGVIALLEQGTLSDIVRETELDKGQLSRGITSLVKKGYLRSKVNKSDQRQHNLHLTQSGQALHDTILPVMRNRQRHLTAEIDPVALDTMLRVLDQLEHASDALPAET